MIRAWNAGGERPTHAAAATARNRFVLRRLANHRGGRAGMVLLAVLAVATVLGPLLVPYDPNWPNYAEALQAPSVAHPLGTDASGRDVLSRLLDGAHRSLGAAVAVLTCLFSVALLLGTAAALAGGLVDTVVMRCADVMMALPGLVLAFAVLGLLGPGLVNLLVAFVIADWAYYARLARAYALNARSREDVIAARLAGIPGYRIVLSHILPAVAIPLGVVASLGLGGMISAISGFSFLGLGVQPPHAEWGAMLAGARMYYSVAPWLLLTPACAITIAVAAANLLGNALRDVLEPGAGP